MWHRSHQFPRIPRRVKARRPRPRSTPSNSRRVCVREGVADLARHPLNDPTPAGATDAGVGVLAGPGDRQAPEFGGTGARPVPLRPFHRRGRRMPVKRPQAHSSAVADRQRDEAGALALLHPHQHGALAGLVQVWRSPWRRRQGWRPTCRPTSRMTSPLCMPCSAAGPLGSTAVTRRPGCRRRPRSAGARVRPSAEIVPACRPDCRCRDCGIGAGWTLIGQSAERERHRLLAAIVQDGELDRGAGRHRADLARRDRGSPSPRCRRRRDDVAGR